jgi:hypothetical protein
VGAEEDDDDTRGDLPIEGSFHFDLEARASGGEIGAREQEDDPSVFQPLVARVLPVRRAGDCAIPDAEHPLPDEGREVRIELSAEPLILVGAGAADVDVERVGHTFSGGHDSALGRRELCSVGTRSDKNLVEHSCPPGRALNVAAADDLEEEVGISAIETGLVDTEQRCAAAMAKAALEGTCYRTLRQRFYAPGARLARLSRLYQPQQEGAMVAVKRT